MTTDKMNYSERRDKFSYCMNAGIDDSENIVAVRIKHTTTATMGGWTHASLLYVDGARVKRIASYNGYRDESLVELVRHWAGTQGIDLPAKSHDVGLLDWLGVIPGFLHYTNRHNGQTIYFRKL